MYMLHVYAKSNAQTNAKKDAKRKYKQSQKATRVYRTICTMTMCIRECNVGRLLDIQKKKTKK